MANERIRELEERCRALEADSDHYAEVRAAAAVEAFRQRCVEVVQAMLNDWEDGMRWSGQARVMDEVIERLQSLPATESADKEVGQS